MLVKDIVEQLCVDLKKALEIPNGLIIEQVLVEIARYALFENKAEVEVVDSGYDVSSHGRITDQKFVLSDYETVVDFLDEPNGNTEATFTSGMGFRAETIYNQIRDVASDLISAFAKDWLREKNIKFESGNEKDEFWDTFSNEEITYPEFFIDEIGKLPFLKIVEKFKEDATFLQTEIEIEEEKEQEEFERKSEIAQRVHEYVTQLAREEGYKKFSVSEKEALWKILIEATSRFTTEEIKIYINSSDFSSITSKKLAYEMVKLISQLPRSKSREKKDENKDIEDRIKILEEKLQGKTKDRDDR